MSINFKEIIDKYYNGDFLTDVELMLLNRKIEIAILGLSGLGPVFKTTINELYKIQDNIQSFIKNRNLKKE